MDKKKVLFVCVHNSARSQIAEAFLRILAGDRFEVTSAGLEPGPINPLAIDVMKEIGIDISGNETRSVFDLYKQGRLFSYVISVCDTASAELCPIFPGLLTAQIHWSFPDPSTFTGSYEEKLQQTRSVRDAIKRRIETWLRDLPAQNH